MLVAFLFVLKSGPLPQRIGIGLFYGARVHPAHVLDRPHRVPHLPAAARAEAGGEEEPPKRCRGSGPRRATARAASAPARRPSLRNACRSSGSKRTSDAGARFDRSPPAVTCTVPSSTVIHAFSFTWCSPSDWPACSTISTARAPSSEWRTIGSRVPSGASSSSRSHRCMNRERFRAWLHSNARAARRRQLRDGTVPEQLLRRTGRARRAGSCDRRPGRRPDRAAARPGADGHDARRHPRHAHRRRSHRRCRSARGRHRRRGVGAGRARSKTCAGDAARRLPASRPTTRRTPSPAVTRSPSRASRST